MPDTVTTRAGRIAAIDWSGRFDHTRSRVALMREYLRRSAWWAQRLDSKDWPFFDVAELVDPSVRANPDVVARVAERLAVPEANLTVKRTCVWSLHFAALLDAEIRLGDLTDPFEPLLLMYERGGSFTLDGTGFIQIDIAGLRIGSRDDHLTSEPRAPLDESQLNALDG